MFRINTEDLSIYVTRGDVLFFSVSAEDENGNKIKFIPNDVIQMTVMAKKNCEEIHLQKTFVVEAESDKYDILLTSEDTTIGDVISKPTDYWYEIVLNPFTNPQTIIGYDDENGAAIFRLFPEGADVNSETELPEGTAIDDELDLTSTNAIQNQAVARAMLNLESEMQTQYKGFIEEAGIVLDEMKDVYAPVTLYSGNPEWSNCDLSGGLGMAQGKSTLPMMFNIEEGTRYRLVFIFENDIGGINDVGFYNEEYIYTYDVMTQTSIIIDGNKVECEGIAKVSGSFYAGISRSDDSLINPTHLLIESFSSFENLSAEVDKAKADIEVIKAQVENALYPITVYDGSPAFSKGASMTGAFSALSGFVSAKTFKVVKGQKYKLTFTFSGTYEQSYGGGFCNDEIGFSDVLNPTTAKVDGNTAIVEGVAKISGEFSACLHHNYYGDFAITGLKIETETSIKLAFDDVYYNLGKAIEVESGTWFPNFENAAGLQYQGGGGSYNKIGNQVTLIGLMTFRKSDSNDFTQILIKDLPFVPKLSNREFLTSVVETWKDADGNTRVDVNRLVAEYSLAGSIRFRLSSELSADATNSYFSSNHFSGMKYLDLHFRITFEI